jgi:hypothetical protein
MIFFSRVRVFFLCYYREPAAVRRSATAGSAISADGEKESASGSVYGKARFSAADAVRFKNDVAALRRELNVPEGPSWSSFVSCIGTLADTFCKLACFFHVCNMYCHACMYPWYVGTVTDEMFDTSTGLTLDQAKTYRYVKSWDKLPKQLQDRYVAAARQSLQDTASMDALATVMLPET